MAYWGLLVVCFCVFAAPAPAYATAGETEWTAGVAFGGADDPIAGVDLAWLRNVTDFWGFGVGLHDRRYLPGVIEGATAATGDVRLVIDALTWVPAVGVALGPELEGRSIAGGDWFTFQWLVRVEGALGYRPARDWGLVFRVGAEQDASGARPMRWTAGIAYTWYRGGGIGLDL